MISTGTSSALQAAFDFAASHGGLLTDRHLATIVTHDRLRPVLVRCGGCRFQCAAQDVANLERCIKAGGDYVRDVSLPIGTQTTIHELQSALAALVEVGRVLISPVHDSGAVKGVRDHDILCAAVNALAKLEGTK